MLPRLKAFALLLFTTLWGCVSNVGPPLSGPYSVVFELAPIDAKTPGRVGWLATYEANGKVARFRIELEPEPKGSELPAFVRCGLFREPGSDAADLLQELASKLGGRVPPPERGVDVLDVMAVVLGRDLSRGGQGDRIAGTFGSEPRGTWFATKLFLGDGEGEVFLNLDPIRGYGEFSLKDRIYGGAVLVELGRLLQGEASASETQLEARELLAKDQVEPAASETPPPRVNPDAVRIAVLVKEAGAGVDQPQRRQALEHLAKMGPRAGSAVPVFLEALTDEDPIIRGEALRGLPKLRPSPEIAVTAVTPLLNDSYSVNQVRAANALADFGQTSTAVNHLTEFLRGESKNWAAAGLMRLGPESRSAVPLLIEMLEKRKDTHEGYAACRALAAIGRDAASALPALEVASADPDNYIRDAAIHAIREIDGR